MPKSSFYHFFGKFTVIFASWILIGIHPVDLGGPQYTDPDPHCCFRFICSLR